MVSEKKRVEISFSQRPFINKANKQLSFVVPSAVLKSVGYSKKTDLNSMVDIKLSLLVDYENYLLAKDKYQKFYGTPLEICLNNKKELQNLAKELKEVKNEEK